MLALLAGRILLKAAAAEASVRLRGREVIAMDNAHANLQRSRLPGPKVIPRTFALVLALLLMSVTAEAQQAGKVYRIGVLSPESPLPGLLENFREGL